MENIETFNALCLKYSKLELEYDLLVKKRADYLAPGCSPSRITERMNEKRMVMVITKGRIDALAEKLGISGAKVRKNLASNYRILEKMPAVLD